MIAFLGLLVLHGCGAALRHVATRCGIGVALRSPASLFVALAVAYACALGWPGAVLLIGWALVARRESVAPMPPREAGAWLGVTAMVLARPWVPTHWDEFVWLAKARFVSLGFSAGVDAALDPAQHLIPAGYPPLWSLAVGWLSWGRDDVGAHVLAASLLVLACAAVAVEAWREELSALPKWSVLVLVAAPLVLVHFRSTYVDLPVGLLGLGLLGLLLRGSVFPSVALAIVLAGFKDEGLAHVLAATAAAFFFAAPRRWALFGPAVAAFLTVAVWRVLVRTSGVNLFDHALGWPAWGEAPRLLQLFVMHATDFSSWGVFWSVVVAVLVSRTGSRSAHALRVMVLANLLFTFAAILMGPERVRVFAENGTLLNRLLVQLWPCAVTLLLSALRPSPPLTDRGA